jgi:hypothetical protein
MTRRSLNRASTQPAAEQAAHLNSGPRRRPHELPESLVTYSQFGRTTHTNCPPRFPVRFRHLAGGSWEPVRR